MALSAPAPYPSVPKWSVFQALCTARSHYDLSHRTLSVLNALLTFLPSNELRDGANLIVFPSNETLSKRCHGMPESTLRRHLASLVTTGLIRRQDSPNGKRYVRRDSDGQITRAFGFDLRPLLLRAPELADIAAAICAEQEEVKSLQEACSLHLRDCRKLASLIENTHQDALEWLVQCANRLRRKLTPPALKDLHTQLSDLRKKLLSACQPTELSGSDNQIERHQQRSKPEIQIQRTSNLEPNDLKTHCPTLASLWPSEVKDWEDLLCLTEVLHPMLPIQRTLWQKALKVVNAKDRALLLTGILERSDRIRNPAAYFQSLLKKVERRQLCPGAFAVTARVDGCQLQLT